MTSAQAASRTATPVAGTRRGAPPQPQGGFRPDIEGLRAVAVLLVVLSHAGVAGFAGGYVGVDVFFVISGFLITSLLAREVAATGTVLLGRFYARRAVRLLPASSLVLVVTLAGTWLWLSPVRVAEHAVDGLASAFYAVNVRLAIGDTDYFAATAPSPFQHFWSLAVEEQFYLVWPLLIVAVCVLLKRRRWLFAVLAAVTAGSFLISVLEIGRAAPWAYFGLHSRAWELGAGALVSLAADRLARLPRRTAVITGLAGLLALLGSAVAYGDGTAFPGFAAILPVGGAAAVVAAGCAFPGWGAGRLLAVPPLQFVGRLSYGLYLWHWPFLVIGPAALGVRGNVWLHLLLCAVAFGAALLTYRWVENPVRHRRDLVARPARGLVLGLTLSASTAVLALIAALLPPAVPVGPQAADTRAVVAAAADPRVALAGLIAAAADVTGLPANLTPALADAPADTNRAQRDGCHETLTSKAATSSCVYGPPESGTTVVLFGDSHALQWFPALEEMANRRGWTLVSLTRSSCSPADVVVTNARLKRTYGECTGWRQAALKRIHDLKPRLVVVSSITNYTLAGDPADPDAVWRDGWARTMTTLTADAKQVTVLGDTPFLTADPVDCLAGADRIDACAEPRKDVLRDMGRRTIAAREVTKAGASFVDPVAWLCAARCPLVVGNVLVYRDDNHLSSAYATVLAPVLESALKP